MVIGHWSLVICHQLLDTLYLPDPGGDQDLAPAEEPQRIIEARASAVSLGNKGRDDLSLGQRVFHGKFGYGIIEAIEGNKLEIEFEKAGRKRVLDSFVSLP